MRIQFYSLQCPFCAYVPVNPVLPASLRDIYSNSGIGYPLLQ